MIEWDFERERPMSDFGDEYEGYYFDKDGVRTVGFGSVLPEYRELGLFKALSEKLKEGVREVIIMSPSLPSIELLKSQGYRYDEERHVMIWKRARSGLMTDVDEVFR